MSTKSQLSHPVCVCASTDLLKVDLVLALLDLHVSVLDQHRQRPRAPLPPPRVVAPLHNPSGGNELLVGQLLYLLPLEAIVVVAGFATLWNLEGKLLAFE